MQATFVLMAVALAGAPEAKFHRMKKVAIVDQYGFERPLPAVSMLVPSDWKFESVVNYLKGMPCGEMLQMSFRASSPDGRLAMDLFPAVLWQWADDPMMRQSMMAANQQQQRFGQGACELQPPMGAADFIAKVVVPKARPGARILGVEPIPDTREALRKQIGQAQAQANQVGLRVRYSADDARAKIAWQGHDEWLTAVTFGQATPAMRGATYSFAARFLFALRSPAGELAAHEKLFRLIASTMRVEPEWQARVAQVQGNIAAARQKGEADRARIRAQSAEEIRRIQSESYQHQQHAQEVQSQRFSQYLRGVETYRDPGTGERVDLSSQYGHAWSNGSGEYILSESPGFDPNAHLNGNWTRLVHDDPR